MATINWADIVGDSTVVSGGYIGDLLTLARAHVDAAIKAGELTQETAGEIYTAMIPSAFQQGIAYAMSEELTIAAIDKAASEALSAEAQLVNERLIAGYHIDGNGEWTGPIETDASGYFQMVKLATQQGMLENQALMVGYETSKKMEGLQADLDLKAKNIEQMQADINFNIAKKTVMEQTRRDNIRMKSAEQFAEFMKYISAANVIPGANDFANMRALINGIGTGLSSDTSVVTITSSGADYVKP